MPRPAHWWRTLGPASNRRASEEEISREFSSFVQRVKGNAAAQCSFDVHFSLIAGVFMKRFMATTATALFAVTTCAVMAFAQSGPPATPNAGPPANPNASTPAVASPSTTNPGAPAAGANSFTEGQAKSRIEAAGFSNVSGLMKDKDGIWRGTASKGGTTTNVALDFQGNVVTK